MRTLSLCTYFEVIEWHLMKNNKFRPMGKVSSTGGPTPYDLAEVGAHE